LRIEICGGIIPHQNATIDKHNDTGPNA
jgi:hypothetical protein